MNQRLSSKNSGISQSEGVTQSPLKKSLSVIIQEDYIKSSGIRKEPIDQSQYIEKTPCKIICDKYFEPVVTQTSGQYTDHSHHIGNSPNLLPGAPHSPTKIGQSDAPSVSCNWQRQLTNLIPQDNYIGSSKSSRKSSSILAKEEQTWPSNEGILTTGRTKADSGADIFCMENSSGWPETRVSNGHNQRQIPIKSLIAQAIGFIDSPVQVSDGKKNTNMIAESYCIIEQNNPEFNPDLNLKRNCQTDIKKLHQKIQSQRRFTFDETLRGEPPTQCNIKIGASNTPGLTKNCTKPQKKTSNDFIKNFINRPTAKNPFKALQLNLTESHIGLSQEPTNDISNNQILKIKNKDGQLIDFENHHSPIRSKKHVQEKQFLFDEAPGSDEDSDNSEFHIQDEVEPQKEKIFPVTVSDILKKDVSQMIVENLSEGSEENSFLIEQDQSSDDEAYPESSKDDDDDQILSMIQKLNSISDENLNDFRDLLSIIQKNLESDIQQNESLYKTQIVKNEQNIQHQNTQIDSEMKPKIEGIFQLRDLMLN